MRPLLLAPPSFQSSAKQAGLISLWRIVTLSSSPERLASDHTVFRFPSLSSMVIIRSTSTYSFSSNSWTNIRPTLFCFFTPFNFCFSLSTTCKKLPGPRAPTIPASTTWTSERLSFIFGHYFRTISASSYFVKETLNLSIYATKRVNLAKCIILAHFCCLVGCNLLHE